MCRWELMICVTFICVLVVRLLVGLLVGFLVAMLVELIDSAFCHQVHSATKYLGGHSDLLAGVVSANDDEFLNGMGLAYKMLGSGLPAFDSFLLLRGPHL